MTDVGRWGVVFDCDGTLFPSEIGSLMRLLDENGLPAKGKKRAVVLRNKYLPRALKGTLTVEDELDWLAETLNIYVDFGVNLAVVKRVVAPAWLRQGVLPCLRELRHRGVATAIVSYGVRSLIVEALVANGARDYFDGIYAADMSVDGTGQFTGHSRDTYVIPSNKDLWSLRFAERHGVSTNKLLAVGDSAGDANLGFKKRNRLGIAPDERSARRLRKYMGATVVTDEFGPVQKWLLRKMR